MTDDTGAPPPEAELTESQLPEVQLAAFLGKYDPAIAAIAEAAAAELRKRLPNFLELVYDNYNALAIGFGPTERASDAVFSIAVYPRWVSLFFLQGNGLRDAGRILKGAGKKARHIVLTSADDLHDERVVALMNEALARTIAARHPAVSYRMIIKSISAKQRPRRSQDDEHAISSAGAERRSNEPPKKKAAVRSQKTVSRGKPPAKPAQRAKSQSPSR